MAYTYKYIPSGEPIQKTAQEEFHDLSQEELDQSFYEADNVYVIQQETALASGSYENVDVRLNQVVNTQTGERNSDDFRKILFKDLNHSVDVGRYYQFSSNYWLTVNTEKLNLHTATATVKRCNNTLRWIDSQGGLHSVPCSIGYLIKENRDYSTAGSNVVVPSGMIEVLVQDNAEIKTLKPNQRFLFGNPSSWFSYRIEGGGTSNFNNQQTLNNSSSGLIRFSMTVDYSNYDTDDLTNGIADAISQVYVLSLNESSLSGNATQTVQLQATVTLNGVAVSRNVIWSSSNTAKATVTAAGLVTFIATGSATITCALENNASVNDTCSVVVGSVPVDNYQVIYSPNVDYVLEGDETTWTVYLFKNGVQQADAFVFSLDDNTVPSTKYTYTVLGDNSFKIKNNGMYLTDELEVTCVSGVYSKVISINLRGAW